eukprot:1429923-Prymnesium_polylepis.1
MHDKAFPQEHKVRLRSFFSQTMHRIRTERYEAILDRMSMRLRGETSLMVARSTLRKVTYLAHPDLEDDFLSKIALVITSDVFARHERIACTKLIVIERGITSKRGKISLMGSCYGEDMILNNPKLRDTAAATALTFVQILLLERPELDELVAEYPIARQVIRRAAVMLAFKRAVIRVATVIRNLELHAIDSYEAYKRAGGVNSLVKRVLIQQVDVGRDPNPGVSEFDTGEVHGHHGRHSRGSVVVDGHHQIGCGKDGHLFVGQHDPLKHPHLVHSSDGQFDSGEAHGRRSRGSVIQSDA